MLLSAIEPKDGERFCLYIDGAYLATVDAEMIVKLRLKAGMEIDAARLGELIEQAQIRKARERALYLLDTKPYTRKQLFDKLVNTNEPEPVQSALDQLEEAGLVDDLAYARQYARETSRYKQYGRQRIVMELRRRGVGQFTIEDALEDFTFNGREEIIELLERRYIRRLSEKNGKDKVLQALIRKGFGFEEGREAIGAFLAAHPEIERQDG